MSAQTQYEAFHTLCGQRDFVFGVLNTETLHTSHCDELHFPWASWKQNKKSVDVCNHKVNMKRNSIDLAGLVE